jgi:hypothetical protein
MLKSTTKAKTRREWRELTRIENAVWNSPNTYVPMNSLRFTAC